MKKQNSVTAVLVVSMLMTALAALAATPAPELPVLNWEPRADWISVKDHGAVGDGKGDDTAAVQAALQLVKSGVTIYFLAGTYRITRTLVLPHHGTGVQLSLTLIGHGRASRLVWDGFSGYPLLQTEGMGYSRIVGLDFDGGGGRRSRASVGVYWCATKMFSTANLFRHCGFRNFLANGVLYEWHEPTRRLASDSTLFDNCLFVNCGTSVSFTQFNDYNYIFDGCEFRQNEVGILSRFGNFFARNSHFEANGTDILSEASEHGCSVRRCTSLNSKRFLVHRTVVAPLTVEGCIVQGWRERVRERPGFAGLPLPFVAMGSIPHIYRREDLSPGDPNQSCPVAGNHTACMAMNIAAGTELLQGQKAEFAPEISHP